MSAPSSPLREPAVRSPSRAVQLASDLVFDREAIRAVDQAAVEEYGIPGIVLMENAAHGLAAEATEMLKSTSLNPATTLIICGSGNNGGDGYALARHLHNLGAEVVLAPLSPPLEESDAGVNYAICRRMKLSEIPVDALDDFARTNDIHLIVDAIFGTGLARPVEEKPAEVIEWINTRARPVLAVDVPSGLDCNTGKPLGSAVRAARTVTLVGLKKGFLHPDAQKYLGEVVVADIGVPIELIRRYGTPITCRSETDR